MIGLYHLLLEWLPSPMRLLVFGCMAAMVVFIILRLVKIALDALPFL